MKYVPSPIEFQYSYAFRAVSNDSGRMQYYKSHVRNPNQRTRITRNDFIEVFNTYKILAVRPIQEKGAKVFQLEFFI